MQKESIPTIDINKLHDSGQVEVLVRPFAEYLEKHHKNLDHPHRHNFYHLVLFTKGSGNHTIDFTNFILKPFQIYFMIPGQVHSWNFDGEVDGIVVNFTESFFQSFLLKKDYLENFSFFNGVAAHSVIDLSSSIGKEVKMILEKVYSQSEGSRARLDPMRVLLLEMFLLIDQANFPEKVHGVSHLSDTVIGNYQRLIEKNYLTLRLPGEYADLLSITPNHLNALCKAHLGIQAGELIRNRVILEAKRLLINLKMTVSEVAYTLNFNDNSYFVRFFKKHTGTTPEEFRKRNA
jgi:AraC family transcriptional regulator, transcriptional activator of pobA